MGYPNKLIEIIVDEAATWLKGGSTRGFAIGRALDNNGFRKAQDRNDVFKTISQKLDYRRAAKREAQARHDTVAAQNLSLPFDPPRKR
jgi:hypothetical protein